MQPRPLPTYLAKGSPWTLAFPCVWPRVHKRCIVLSAAPAEGMPSLPRAVSSSVNGPVTHLPHKLCIPGPPCSPDETLALLRALPAP